jgi:hypothetical protein
MARRVMRLDTVGIPLTLIAAVLTVMVAPHIALTLTVVAIVVVIVVVRAVVIVAGRVAAVTLLIGLRHQATLLVAAMMWTHLRDRMSRLVAVVAGVTLYPVTMTRVWEHRRDLIRQRSRGAEKLRPTYLRRNRRVVLTPRLLVSLLLRHPAAAVVETRAVTRVENRAVIVETRAVTAETRAATVAENRAALLRRWMMRL